ncbi:hypothetical protein ER308_12685 [Egibacter rhizosphaerae]|uniref:Uncharacterized protein n=1 Tax=Egibacter rhizosphaerae TaxID=1670831 RepID=A0A411YGP1_9ACTN|nr:hypothetical protein [Egibacter rhizosphaerae]QBI20336.1 hypothetical protein ER308_12685 [Egibacter rhizosphaerae]
MDWIAEFFGTLPELFSSLWEFADGTRGLLVTFGSAGAVVLLCVLAAVFRDRQGWQSAVFGAMAALVGAFWLFGVIPSAWTNFANDYEALLSGLYIPGELVTPQVTILGLVTIPELEVATDLYLVIRDSVAMVITFIGVGVLVFVALWVQKRYPRTLAPDERPRPETGGRTDVGAARP